MSLTYTKKRTMKQFTQLGLPAVLLSMAAGSAHAYNLDLIDINNINTPEQAVAELKKAGLDLNDAANLTDYTGGIPAALDFPYTNAAGVTELRRYSFKNFDDLKAQAVTIAKDYQALTKTGGTFNLDTITGTVNLQGKEVKFTTKGTAAGTSADNFVTIKSDIPSLDGKTFTSADQLSNYVNGKPAETVAIVNGQPVVTVEQIAKADLLGELNAGGLGNQSGNPASHVSQMSYYDSVIDTAGVAAGNVTGATTTSRFTPNFRYNNYNFKGTSAELYTLSLGYNLELGNGWGVLVNLPMSYVDTGTAGGSNDSYRISMGTGVRIPASKLLNITAVQWDVIPLFRLGGVGLGSNAWDNTSVAYSGGVQSNVGTTLGAGFSAIVQNQYTYNVDAAQYTLAGVTPEDHNVHAFRNGIQLVKDMDAQLFGKAVNTSFSFADVRFDSNMLGIDNQQEYGINVGLKGNGVAANDVRLNFTYTNADSYDDAVSVNLGGSF